MFYEPTTLAAAASAMVEALEGYGCDARAVFRAADVNMEAILRPGARYPYADMVRLWRAARNASGDPCIGVTVGQKVRPTALHALGVSWLSSPTVLEGLHRIERYAHVANTALQVNLTIAGGQVKIARVEMTGAPHLAPEGIDAYLTAVISMCRTMMNSAFAPLLVSFRHEDHGHSDRYVTFFRAPVQFSAPEDALYFELADVQRPVPAGNRELALENDRITERYLATLNREKLQDRVREILLRLLPSGKASRQAVAAELNRSVSTLQRQLKAEGASYREILEQTRQTLAQQLVREQRYSLSQIAYLLGFSDQANFSRAFRRWTGSTPKRFRNRVAASA